MSRILVTCIILTLLALSAGCLQPSATTPAPAPVAVTPAPVVSETLPPAVVSTPGLTKHLSFDVSKSENSVNVTYTGGPDASSLVSMTIRITNRDGTTVAPRTIQNPEVGSPYIFTYHGVANPSVLNIVGTFNDGTQQTVLMYYF